MYTGEQDAVTTKVGIPHDPSIADPVPMKLVGGMMKPPRLANSLDAKGYVNGGKDGYAE